MVRTGSLIITQEMLSLIAEIDEFKGAWRLLGKLATIESVGSSCGHEANTTGPSQPK